MIVDYIHKSTRSKHQPQPETCADNYLPKSFFWNLRK